MKEEIKQYLLKKLGFILAKISDKIFYVKYYGEKERLLLSPNGFIFEIFVSNMEWVASCEKVENKEALFDLEIIRWGI